jgi:hypothetical protein
MILPLDLVGELLELLNVGGKNIQKEDFLVLIANWNIGSEFNSDLSLDDLMNIENYIWELANVPIALFQNDDKTKSGIQKWLIKLCDSLKNIQCDGDNASTDSSKDFIYKLLLIVYQLTKVSLLSKMYIYSEQLIITILHLLDSKNDSIIDKLLCLMVSELAEMGFNSSQMLNFYKHLVQLDDEVDLSLFYSLFTNESYINNSSIFHQFDQELKYPGLSLNTTKPCFILSSWIKLSHSMNYKKLNTVDDTFKFSELTHPNGLLLINYSIHNGRIRIATPIEEQWFDCFYAEFGKLYNISFAHVCEGKRMMRIDLYVNAMLIESKIISNIFGQHNQLHKMIFSRNGIQGVLFDFSLTGPNQNNSTILELTNTYIVETTNFIDWICYIKFLGPNYTGTFMDSDISSLITSTKLTDMYLTIKKTLTNFGGSSTLKINTQEIVLVSTNTFKNNLNDSMQYYYKKGMTLEKSEVKNKNILIKNGSSLLNVLDSLGGSTICLQLIENSETEKELLRNFNFLFDLLKLYKPIESNFIRTYGFETLGLLLKSKKDILTIELLDCILKFVGYDVFQPVESILKNRLAYRALILDFEIWQCLSIAKNKIVNKFLLYQFTVFAQESKYAQYNIKQISDMKIVKRILLALKKGDFHEEVIPVLHEILWIMIKFDHSAEVIRLLQLHVIFSLNKDNLIHELGGETILNLLYLLATEYPKTINAYSLKFLLSIMKGSLEMRKIGLKLIINLVSNNTKMYTKFLSFGGFSILTNYLKSDWNENDILIDLFLAIFPDQFLCHDKVNSIVAVSESFQDESIKSFKCEQFFGVLNNLMKFAALQSENSNAKTRLKDYISMLEIMKLNPSFQKIFLNNTELVGNIIFLACVIKQNQNEKTYQRYTTFLSNYLVDRLYLDEKDEILTLFENIYKEYPVEFNIVMMPLLFTKISSFKSLSGLAFFKSNKTITLFRLLLFYFQSNTTQTDDVEFLKNIEISFSMIAGIFKTRDQQSKLIPFLNTLSKELNQSFISLMMYYISNNEILSKKIKIERLKSACQTFMSNPDTIIHMMNISTFFLFFSTLFQIVNIDEEVFSLGLNCMRISLLEIQRFESYIDNLSISKTTKDQLNDLARDILVLNDDQIQQIFTTNENVVDYLNNYFTEKETTFSRTFSFELSKKKIDEYITEKLHAQKSYGKIQTELEQFINLIFNEESKILNSNIQDEIDDYYYYIDIFETLKGNLPYSTTPAHKELYSTEAMNRKRNKLVNVISDEAYEIFKGKDIQKGFGRLEKLSDDANSLSDSVIKYNTCLDDFNVVCKLDAFENNFDEDRNRRILRNLLVHDRIHEVHNVTQIIGLDAKESILILGAFHLYIVEGYFYNNGDFCCSYEAPEDQRDELVYLLMGLGVSKNDKMQDSSNNVVKTENRQFKRHKSKSWLLSSLVSISKRNFLLRDIAFELFFKNGSSILLTCTTSNKRDKIFNKLTSNIVSKLEDKNFEEALKFSSQKLRINDTRSNGFSLDFILSNSNDILSSDITSKWCNGEISNFQYLMLLNTVAGRTFNDLTQYPVFPFVLSDYTSSTIDLNDPKVYRDLTKPMGAQTLAREKQFQDRYEATKEMSPQTPPFHYGTHYSSAMIVTSYLIRLHPFTESYLKLQGGKFDHPDRLFYSISKLWNSASTENTTDVRELIPEFYYLPEFLVNSNNFQFGASQDGVSVNNVELPPWSNNDPFKFIRIMRDALESDYVSEHLPEWIDLIFGYKQQGIEAVNATNVFHYLSYPGSVDLENIHDVHERAVIVSIIHNFGQTPLQILKRKHPIKNCRMKIDSFNMKKLFIQNFSNEVIKDDEKYIPKWNKIAKKIDKIMYIEKGHKWIGVGQNEYLCPGIHNYEMKIEQIGINSLIINDIHTFEELIVGGRISIISILTKNKFIVGFDDGVLKIFEYCDDKFKYVTNAQRSNVKLESNLTIEDINNNKTKNMIFSKLQNDKERNFMLIEIGDLLGGHENAIIKIKYLRHDSIIISLDNTRNMITVWHEPSKLDLKSGEIFKMTELVDNDKRKIIDFDVIEDDCLIYGVNEMNELIVWRINSTDIIVKKSLNLNNVKLIRICENFTGNDYSNGTLFLIKYINDEDRIKYSVFYHSRDLQILEKLIDIDINDDITDLRFGRFKDGKIMIVYGNEYKIIFMK